MSTATPEQAAEAALSPPAGSRPWRARRRWAATGVVVVVVAAGVVAAVVTGGFGWPSHPSSGLSGNTHPAATATVTRRSLSSQTQVQATLGDAGSYTVVNQAQGTITALPSVGHVVRQGQVLYQVSGSPVVLLYGPVPAYRDLSEGLTGPDVAELNTDLVRARLCHRRRTQRHSDYFSAETAYALEKLQARLGGDPDRCPGPRPGGVPAHRGPGHQPRAEHGAGRPGPARDAAAGSELNHPRCHHQPGRCPADRGQGRRAR